MKLSIFPLPPVRFFIGSVLLAAVIVFLEKASGISSGGVGGLGIALSHFTGLSIALINTLLKCSIFLFVFWQGGTHLGVWTIISTLISGFFMWVFELMPQPELSKITAFVLILLFSYFPAGLLLSKGYSTGGFSAVAQVLFERYKIPLWLSMLLFNCLPIVSMYLSYGLLSGSLTLIATLWAGFSTDLWTRIINRISRRTSNDKNREVVNCSQG